MAELRPSQQITSSHRAFAAKQARVVSAALDAQPCSRAWVLNLGIFALACAQFLGTADTAGQRQLVLADVQRCVDRLTPDECAELVLSERFKPTDVKLLLQGASQLAMLAYSCTLPMHVHASSCALSERSVHYERAYKFDSRSRVLQ